MRNNFKALILHFVIEILSFIFLIIFVATGPKIAKYTSNIMSRLFLGVAFLLVYIFSGTLLDRNTSKKYDFLKTYIEHLFYICFKSVSTNAL